MELLFTDDKCNLLCGSPFVVAFCGVPGISTGSFATPTDLTGTLSGPVALFNNDLDGDGKADLIVANRFGNTVSVFRNTSSGAGNVSFTHIINCPNFGVHYS